MDEVMLLSCLFLIGPSGDGRHNNSFVEGVRFCRGRGREGGTCAHVRWAM